MTRRSFESALMLEIEASGIFGRKVRLDRQRRADACAAHARRPRKTSCRDSRTVSQLRVDAACTTAPPPPRPPRAPTDSRSAACRLQRQDGTRSPPRPRPPAISASRDQHHVEPHEPVLELGDHRRRRVAGDPLPDPALHGGDEVDDPGADRDARASGSRRWTDARSATRWPPRARRSARRSAGDRAATVTSSGG